MFLLYSDAFIESVNREDQQLGTRGILELLNKDSQIQPQQVIPFLRQEVSAMANRNLLDDDATLILGHFTSAKVRLRDNLLAPFRLLGDVSDNTRLKE